LCNIHASTLGYIVVVDSPWYGQAGRGGRLHIRDVPPGKSESMGRRVIGLSLTAS